MANYECETRRCARLNFFQDRSSWIEVVAAYSRRWHQPCHTVRAHLQAKPSRDLAGAPPGTTHITGRNHARARTFTRATLPHEIWPVRACLDQVRTRDKVSSVLPDCGRSLSADKKTDDLDSNKRRCRHRANMDWSRLKPI